MEALSAPSSWVSSQPHHQLQAGGKLEGQFRLMLVQDGYDHLDQTITALQSRDLPKDAEVLLLSVSDLFQAPLHLVGRDLVQSAPNRTNRRPGLPKFRKAQAFFDKRESVTRQARARLQAAFPDWDISFERPLSWQPDLIFVGAFNQSLQSNTGLSEIIRKISTESTIPVIVARPQSQRRSPRAASVIAFDGRASAAAIVKELQRRSGDGGRDFYLMFYKDPLTSQAERWSAAYEEPDRELIHSQLVKTKNAIEALGHKVICLTAVGHTAEAILNEARRVEAESVLLGTGPLVSVGSLSPQSLAVTVAAQANCSVELVFSGERPRPTATLRAIAAPRNIAAWKGRNDSRVSLSSSL